LYEYIATNGFLSVAQENLAEAVPVEKTLSIFELLTSGGLAGNIIMASLFLMFFVALYLYFERLMAINAASKSTSTSWDK
jgi:biopolymer transport protein ExbB